MSLQQRLRDDLKQALKLAEIGNAEIAQGVPLDDPKVLGIIAQEVKQHRESIDAFSKGGRQDLISKEEAELAILLEYLPKQMSREEIVAAAHQAIEEVGAWGCGDKGKVMSKLMTQLKGKAEGKEVSTIVSELLANSSGG
jgi:hypothetical protein